MREIFFIFYFFFWEKGGGGETKGKKSRKLEDYVILRISK